MYMTYKYNVCIPYHFPNHPDALCLIHAYHFTVNSNVNEI